MRTRQSVIFGAAMLASLGSFMGAGSTINGVTASAIRADLAARTGSSSGLSQGALARILGSGGQRSSKAWLPGFNGRAHTGVAAQRRAARKARRVQRQKAVGRRWA